VLLNPLPGRGLRERRRMSLLRLHGEDHEVCVGNLHLTAGASAQAEREALAAAEAAVAWAWAGSTPLVLGGDFNLRPRSSEVFKLLEERFGLTGPTSPDAIDHLLARGLEVIRPAAPWPPEMRELEAPVGLELRRLRLSDHAPVEAAFGLR
jgi:endonuclease/exonuclease/phosphatase family metal-dependent hydrolase